MTTATETMITLPKGLVSRVAELAERDQPAEVTIREILEQWIQNRDRVERFMSLAGFVNAEDHPEWATREDVVNWVRALRGGTSQLSD